MTTPTIIETPGFKPKKSVALSGVTAGNTALCTVGRTGNDLHYRSYDILDIAEVCEFEEIAHLLVHGKLPTRAELRAYKAKLKALRGLPLSVKQALEQLPAASHPMDVMRTGVSALGCALPEKDDHNLPGARDIADRLMASLGSMLLYWYHWASSGRRIEVETDDDSIGAHFLHLLHGTPPSAAWERAMHTSLNLYAEHEFNASTFSCRVIAGTGSDLYSAITGGFGALSGQVATYLQSGMNLMSGSGGMISQGPIQVGGFAQGAGAAKGAAGAAAHFDKHQRGVALAQDQINLATAAPRRSIIALQQPQPGGLQMRQRPVFGQCAALARGSDRLGHCGCFFTKEFH